MRSTASEAGELRSRHNIYDEVGPENKEQRDPCAEERADLEYTLNAVAQPLMVIHGGAWKIGKAAVTNSDGTTTSTSTTRKGAAK